jgi:CRISPR/Cas system CSM-associated protein Csm2 small subunit
MSIKDKKKENKSLENDLKLLDRTALSAIDNLITENHNFGAIINPAVYFTLSEEFIYTSIISAQSDSNETIEQQLAKSKERILRLKDISMKLRASNTPSTHQADSFLDLPEKHEKALEEINKELSLMRSELSNLKQSNDALKEIVFSEVASYGDEAVKQLIPVNVYLDTDHPNLIYTSYQSVLDFLVEIGFETSIDFPPRKGSWIKRWISRSVNAMTNEQVTNRLKEAEYAVEVNTILKPQSEVEKNQSEALVGMIKSLEGIQNAVIRIGSLILVKVTSPTGEVNIQVRTLSIAELHLINKNPMLLEQPQQILKAFSKLIEDESAISDSTDISNTST